MPNKTYSDAPSTASYFSRPQCAQQPQQQYLPPYQNNAYNMYQQYQQQYQSTANVYEHVDNWLPDPRLASDKIETIEISSKDLSPASCCSNIDLLLPDFYKSGGKGDSWFGGKSYVEYPSCSQANCEQEGTVKYCSIQKSNFSTYDCNQYYEDSSLLNITDVFPTFDSMSCLEPQEDKGESSNSDIIVEESEDEYLEDERKFSCIICQLSYTPLGNQFYFLTPESPLTMSSQKPVYDKIKNLVSTQNVNSIYLCSLCLGLINTIDHLELKLDGCKMELSNKIKAKSSNVTMCEHKITCELCQKTLTLDLMHKTHMLHHKIKRKFLCEVCGCCFNKRTQFLLHLKTHRSKTVKKARIKIDAFICKYCKKPFRTKSNLIGHENYCSGKLPFKCRQCNKKFPTPTKLKNHTRLKHDKKFTSICSICNIGFVKISSYKSHMTTHSADKKYSCTKCDKSYKTISNLKFHMKFHESKLPFICKICDRGFMRREYLDSHVALHSGERNYVCSFCNKTFASQKNLDRHLKTHDDTSSKKSCNICGKLISKGLEDHLRTHANLKEFECDLCELRFNTRSALIKHKKRKHD